MNKRDITMETEVWALAKKEADVRLVLPGGVELFFRKIAAKDRCFLMGSRNGEPREEPRHRVKFDHDFWLGTFVVTQTQWRVVALADSALQEKAEPSRFKDKGERRPVEQVSWNDAVAWCESLMKTQAYRDAVEAGTIPKDIVACLPSETEWEFACRDGSSEDLQYYNGDGEAALAEVGWYDGNSGGETHDVDEPVGGRIERHPFRLFGMHGNVWEWCSDFTDWNDMGEYRKRVDGGGPLVRRDGQQRVVRGGSWVSPPRGCRSAYRFWFPPGDRYWLVGFRVCLAPGSADAKALADRPIQTDKGEAGRRDGGRGTSPESGAPSAAGGVADAEWDAARLPGMRGETTSMSSASGSTMDRTEPVPPHEEE